MPAEIGFWQEVGCPNDRCLTQCMLLSLALRRSRHTRLFHVRVYVLLCCVAVGAQKMRLLIVATRVTRLFLVQADEKSGDGKLRRMLRSFVGARHTALRAAGEWPLQEMYERHHYGLVLFHGPMHRQYGRLLTKASTNGWRLEVPNQGSPCTKFPS